MSATAVRVGVLAFGRGAVGISTLITPVHAATVFGLPLNPEASLLGRLFGSRDLILAAYLWRTYRNYKAHEAAEDPLQTPIIKGNSASINDVRNELGNGNSLMSMSEKELSKRDLGTALWLGLLVDGIDVLSGIACILEGNVSDMGKIAVVGGASLLAGLGYWQVKVLQK